MGSSSSKPRHYPYLQTSQPVSTGYPYPAQGQGQFGYYVQQVGSEPGQVQAIPGYYYYPSKQRVRSRTSHKRHNSAPLPSKAPQQPQENNEDPASPSSEQATAPNSAPAAEPVGVSASPPAAAPEAPAEATDGSNNVNDDPPQPAEPSAPDPAQYKLTNPLPAVPQSTLETDPYRSVRRTQNSGLPGVSGHYAAPIASVTYKPHLRSQYRPSKGKDPVLKPPRPHEELIREVRSGNTGKGPFMRLRSFTMPSLSGMMGKKSSRSPIPTHSISYPYPYATVPGSRGPMPASPISLSPPVSAGPPIIIPLHSSLNPTSLHKILYKKKLYPTAAHLFEAHKYLKQRPELSERIRTSSSNAAEMDALSKAFELDGFVRYDWSVVWRDKMDEVLYLKFVQHPRIRAELMATGYSPLVDGNEPRRPDGEGVNELGKALVRLRDRLRREGAR